MADNPAKKRMVIALDPQLHEQLRRLALRSGMSIRATAVQLIAEALESWHGPAAAAAGPGDPSGPKALGGGHKR